MLTKCLKDFEGDGTWSVTNPGEVYEEVLIMDVLYENNKDKNVVVILKNGDSFEYIRKVIENRRIMPAFLVKSPREMKAVDSAITALLKLKENADSNNENIIKKIKSTFIKLSVDEGFNYRYVADIIKEKSNDIDVDLGAFEKDGFDISPEYLSKVILNQTVYSLEEFSYIHPKIKLLIGMINKNPLGLEFETE